MATAWCADGGGRGSPMVTSTDGHSDAIVWLVGAEGDNRLHGFDGDTGAPVVTTGAMGPVRRYVTPIVAKGRIYVAGDEQVYAFRTDSTRLRLGSPGRSCRELPGNAQRLFSEFTFRVD